MEQLITAVPAAPLTADIGRRTISGVIVEWNTIGHTSAGPTRFAFGSIAVPDPANFSRVKLTGEHDQEDPAGYATSFEQTPTGLRASFHVPPGPRGDRALLEAANHTRDGLSVVVQVDTGGRDAAGVLEVAASTLRSVGQVAVPAYTGAYVDLVAANQTQPPPMPAQPPAGFQLVPAEQVHPASVAAASSSSSWAPPASPASPAPAAAPPGPAAPPSPPAGPVAGSSSSSPPMMLVPVVAAAPAAPNPAGDKPTPDPRRFDKLGLRGLSVMAATVLGAGRDSDPAAVEELRAALTTGTTADFTGITPPAFVADIAGIVNMGRPTVNRLAIRPLPPTGMSVTYPAWDDTKRPVVDVQNPELTEVASGPVSIPLATCPVITIAGGNEFSLQVVERSNPSVIQAVLEEFANVFAQRCNAKALTDLAASARNVATLAGDDLVTIIAKLIAAMDPAHTPRSPIRVGIGWTLFAGSFDIREMDGPAMWDMSVSVASALAEMGTINEGTGLDLYVDPMLGAKDVIVFPTESTRWYEDSPTPFTMGLGQPSVLGTELAVYGNIAFAVRLPANIDPADVPILKTTWPGTFGAAAESEETRQAIAASSAELEAETTPPAAADDEETTSSSSSSSRRRK